MTHFYFPVTFSVLLGFMFIAIDLSILHYAFGILVLTLWFFALLGPWMLKKKHSNFYSGIVAAVDAEDKYQEQGIIFRLKKSYNSNLPIVLLMLIFVGAPLAEHFGRSYAQHQTYFNTFTQNGTTWLVIRKNSDTALLAKFDLSSNTLVGTNRVLTSSELMGVELGHVDLKTRRFMP